MVPDVDDLDADDIGRLFQQGCMSYLVREMEVPFICQAPTNWTDYLGRHVQMVTVQDWSGTVVVRLACGIL